MSISLRFLAILIGFGLLTACNSPTEPEPNLEKPALKAAGPGNGAAVSDIQENSTKGARINVDGCQNDDGETDIFLPDGDFRFGVPIISSNCVLDAGPTEHLIVHSELPDDVSPPDRPVVWNYENTELPCWANNREPKFTTDWEQRITPSGKVHLTCHFNAKKSEDG